MLVQRDSTFELPESKKKLSETLFEYFAKTELWIVNLLDDLFRYSMDNPWSPFVSYLYQ